MRPLASVLVERRAQKGARLARDGAVREVLPGAAYLVRSERGEGSYTVLARTSWAPARCDCADQRHRGGRCGHLVAVALWLHREGGCSREESRGLTDAGPIPVRRVEG